MLETATFVGLVGVSVISSELLLEPSTDTLAQRSLLACFCVVGVDRSREMLPVTNLLTEPVLLPEEFLAALYETEACSQMFASLSSSTGYTSPREIVASGLDQMIPETLDLPQRQQLLSLL